MRRRREGGFTMIEIMVSMGLMVIGLAGVLALHMATVRGNRVSRQLERARVLAVQLMEDLRGRPISELEATICPLDPIDTVQPVEGTVYERRCTIEAVSGTTVAGDLVLVTARVSFGSDEGGDSGHQAMLQMIRTRQESL